MKKNYLSFLFLCIQVFVFAQSTPQTNTTTVPPPKPPAFSTTLYGFVRNDMVFDSRLTEYVREGQLALWPKGKDLVNGKDFNDKSQLNILGILTRLGVRIAGPDVLGAKVTGLVEGDFFGQAEPNIGLLRLRHGFVKMEWKNAALTLGQTWYPLFIPEAFLVL